MSKYIAVDLGASNGRVIVGNLESFEVANRFETRNDFVNGSYYWDIMYIFSEIKKGIKKAVKMYPGEIKSIGIDTWGVDYGLVDGNGRLLSNPCMYRDHRTDEAMNEVFKTIPKEEIYKETGIQFAQFNTIYQLWADKKNNPEMLSAAKRYLSIPDLLNYWLSGIMANEATHATTTQLYNPVEKDWSWKLIKKLELPENIFKTPVPSGTILGPLKKDILKELNIGEEKQIEIIAVGSHDTASAVASVPVAENEDNLFLSSGTWSLLGLELPNPVINSKTLEADFTNEGSVTGGTRLIKNIMGMWILQESKRWWDKYKREYSWDELSDMAESAGPVDWTIDPNNTLFFHPSTDTDPMPKRIEKYCIDRGKQPPETIAQTVRGILQSLAQTYTKTISKMEEITGRKYNKLFIVGGGSQDRLLCRLTADTWGGEVLAGPVEATALGNILVQELTYGKIKSIAEGRQIIKNTQTISIYNK